MMTVVYNGEGIYTGSVSNTLDLLIVQTGVFADDSKIVVFTHHDFVVP